MFKNLFGKRRSVGLDVGASSVKMVELAGKANKLRLTALGAGSLTPDTLVDGQILDTAQTSEVIGKLLQGQNVKTRDVVAGFGSYSTIIKIIDLPMMSEEELRESIDWHAEEHIPFDMSDVRLDYQTVGSTGDSLQAMIIACRHEPVQNLEEVIRRAGYRAAIIDADSLALQNCYTFNYQPVADSLIALIHIGASKMMINIVRGHRCEFTREVSLGGNQYTDRLQKELGLTFEQAEAVKLGSTDGVQINAANVGDALDGLSKLLTDEEQVDDLLKSVLDLFALEISKSLDFFHACREEDGFEVQKIMLSGGSSHLKGLREFLSRTFKIPVEPLDPFRLIKCDPKRFSPDYLSRVGPEMAIAVGLSLRGTNSQGLMEINLTEASMERKLVELENNVDKEAPGVYEFTGRNRLYEVVRGERAASSPESLRLMLKREQVVLTSCKLKDRSPTPRRKPKKIDESDLESFTRRFSLLVDMGLPLVTCLDELAREQKNERLGQVIEQVRQDVEEGSTLTQAFERHSEVFGEFYVRMIEAGEWGGIIDLLLKRLADELERRVKLRRQLRLAMLSPLSIFAGMLAVVTPLLILGVSGGVNASNGDSHVWSRAVASIGAFLISAPAVIALLSLAAASLLLYAYVKTDGGRRRKDELLLRLPFLGPFLRRYAVARFARTLSMLLSSGVPVLSSLRLTEDGAGNVVFKDAVSKLRDGVERGESFSEVTSEEFPGIVRLLIGVGEQTGAVDAALGKVADLYEQEIERTITVLPVVILFGLAVLFALVVGVPLFFAL
jgi:type IV pilus assembly protein PilM